jgi:hypothetical protein
MLSMRTFPTLVLLPILLLMLTVSSARAAVPGMPPRGKVLLGVGGHALTPGQFSRLTGAEHDIHLITIPWNEQRTWNEALDNSLEASATGGYRLMVHLGPQRVDNGREGRSPGAVARGEVDAYLLDMGRVLNDSGQVIYLRPPAEMNGHWSLWSAYDQNGTRRNADHSTRSYRAAFVRIALIARGGNVTMINRRLAAHRMPALRTDETSLPRSGRIAMVFNPQARGKPDVRGNQPWDYYPGRPFVDYVANDLYAQSGRVAWDAHEALYRRYSRSHPFMVAEFAPWGYDDPTFVKRMFGWVASHRRTVALMYFNGTSGTTFQLSSKRRSLAMYSRLARQSRYRCAGLDAFSASCSVAATRNLR